MVVSQVFGLSGAVVAGYFQVTMIMTLNLSRNLIQFLPCTLGGSTANFLENFGAIFI